MKGLYKKHVMLELGVLHWAEKSSKKLVLEGCMFYR